MGFEASSSDVHAVSFHETRSSKRVTAFSPLKSIVLIVACALFGNLAAHAQGVGSSASITGSVTDSAGAVLPKSTVTIVDTQTGLKRTVNTDTTGQYRVEGLSRPLMMSAPKPRDSEPRFEKA